MESKSFPNLRQNECYTAHATKINRKGQGNRDESQPQRKNPIVSQLPNYG